MLEERRIADEIMTIYYELFRKEIMNDYRSRNFLFSERALLIGMIIERL